MVPITSFSTLRLYLISLSSVSHVLPCTSFSSLRGAYLQLSFAFEMNVRAKKQNRSPPSQMDTHK